MPQNSQFGNSHQSRHGRSDEPDLERVKSAIGAIPSDERRAWLEVGMALNTMFRGSEVGKSIWDAWSSQSSKFDLKGQDSTWRGFRDKPGGIGAGTLFHLAKEHGWPGFTTPLVNGSKSARFNGQSTEFGRTDRGISHSKATARPWEPVEPGMMKQGYMVIAAYDYRNADGSPYAQKIRFENPNAKIERERKTFIWRQEVGGRLVTGTPDLSIPPYCLRRLLENLLEPVIIVEGEKDADTLNALGFTAISIEDGKAQFATDYLRHRTVYVIPDNDETGEKRASRVMEAIKDVADHCHLVRIGGAKDVTEWMSNGHDAAELNEVIGEAVRAETTARLAGITWHKDIGLSPAARYLIDEVLPAEGIGFLWGESYLGKSFVAHSMAMAVARGVPFAGKFDTEAGVAIYIAMEAEGSLRDRHHAYTVEHGVNGDPPFRLLSYPLDICDLQSVNGLIEKLEAVRELKGTVRLLIIDTLSKAMAGRDETKDMPLAVKNMELIQKSTRGVVIAVHHSGKDKTSGMRGGYAAFAGADVSLRIDGSPKQEIRTLVREKLKNGSPGQLAGFRIEGRDFGEDERGKPINIGVAVWIDAEPPKQKSNLTEEQGALLEHLRQLIINQQGAITTPQKDGYPSRPYPAVCIDDLVERAIKGENVSVRAAVENKPKSIREMLRKLAHRGIVGMFDSLVWLIKENT